MKCCICGKEIPKDQGNNPWPVKDEGLCCDECNYQKVIPARIEMMTEELERVQTITALLVEPGRQPRAIEIANDVKNMQDTVGGYIEVVYPFEDPVCLIVNEEGKVRGLPQNRPIFAGGKIVDMIVGSFLVVGNGVEDFCSLTPELAEKYTEHFRLPMVVSV